MVPGCLLAGPGHGVAPGDDQLDPVLEGERAAGHQCGVLAQAVAGAGGGGEAEALHRIEDDQAEHGGGQLGVLGPGQLLNGRLEQEVGQVAAGRSDASPTTSHEGWSTQGSPIPDRCEPCPGKVKTNTAATSPFVGRAASPTSVARPPNLAGPISGTTSGVPRCPGGRRAPSTPSARLPRRGPRNAIPEGTIPE
jgi:hypothetical protein